MNDNEILLKEYELLRTEIIERIKIAFSHLGYFGAVLAFAFPVASNLSDNEQSLPIVLALFGAAILAWVSMLNWYWVQRISSHLMILESEINKSSGNEILKWEGIAANISTWVLFPPKKYPDDENNDK